MTDEFDKLKNQWVDAKSTAQKSDIKIDEVIKRAKQNKKSVLYAHYGNMLILTLTLIMISAFFFYVTSFQNLISKIGVALMIGGLALRIVIELISSFRSRQIDLTEHAISSVNSSLQFYQFRRKIHGPVTVSIVSLYTLGFYMLTPEFSVYIDLFWMIIMDVGYVIGAIILITVIRKGIKKEMQDLAEIVQLKDELVSS
ncbi:hypothetical protein [Ekhidna sp.]|uniref:hypothetical protein n=1 Tax=Ekhidna sp. TaxID=2608089 RepID=UPI003BAAC5E5